MADATPAVPDEQPPRRHPAIVVWPRPTLRVGDKVRLACSKRRWEVRGVTRAGRFVILTQPFNLQHTVLYTVIDFDRAVRGKDDHYGLGYETEEDIAEALAMFQETEDGLKTTAAREAAAERGETSWESVPSADVSFRSGNHVRLDMQAINEVPCSAFGGDA